MNLMIVAGVHLDRAWSGLGAAFGTLLRAWSRDMLAHVVEEARRRDAGALVIAGDLFDRSTVLPATVDYAAKVLGSFGGHVLIAPGRSDWIGGAGPYGYQSWPDNVHIWTEAEYQPALHATAVWASAWVSSANSAPRVPDAPSPRVLVRAGMTVADLDRTTTGHGDALVTTGTVLAEKVMTVPDLVRDPREAGGYALIVNADDPTQPAQRVDLPEQPGGFTELDVTRQPNTGMLAAAIEDAAKRDASPLVLRLVGTLAPPVLLPGFGGPDLPSGVVLDLDALQYGQAEPEPSDRSARAEFLRAMAETRTSALERHQTTALGLAVLDTDIQGA